MKGIYVRYGDSLERRVFTEKQVLASLMKMERMEVWMTCSSLEVIWSL